MNILEVIAEVLSSSGPPRLDNDRSIVGESPIEQSASRFWRRLVYLLLFAAGVGALYVWVLQPSLGPGSP